MKQETIAKGDISDKGLEILLNEYNQCNARIEEFLKRQDSILQISMAIIGGVIAFTLLNEVPDEIYVVIPLVVLIVLIQILYHYTRVIANQGYREYLQNQLNKILPRESKILYTTVAKKFLLQSNPIAKLNGATFPLIVGASVIYAMVMSHFNLFVIVSLVTLLFVIIIVAVKSKSYFQGFNEKVYNFCIETENDTLHEDN